MQGALGIHVRRDRIRRGGEAGTDAVTRGAEDVPAVGGDGRPQQGIMAHLCRPHRFGVLLGEAGAPLDIGEEEGDGTGRQRGHAGGRVVPAGRRVNPTGAHRPSPGTRTRPSTHRNRETRPNSGPPCRRLHARAHGLNAGGRQHHGQNFWLSSRSSSPRGAGGCRPADAASVAAGAPVRSTSRRHRVSHDVGTTAPARWYSTSSFTGPAELS